jgi:PAS domain S-box-containing protein
VLPERQPVEVVAVVASAGGLDAFTAVLRALPPELPVPILVQQHLGGQASVLPKILARRTAWTVVWAENGAELEGGRVMVCPARSQVEVLPDRTLSVTELAPSGNRPHDVLLTSLADSCGPGAVAVVLTGGGSDGAAGVTALRAAGGVVIAQSEDTAEYPSMPAAAARAGADLVVPLHEIGKLVADVVRREALPRPDAELDALRAVFGDEGRVAAFARDIDWSRTPVGAVRRWSPVLRSIMRFTMGSPRGTALFWGDDHLYFMNEASLDILDVDRLPEYFARPYLEGFPQFADVVPMIERVRAGESVLLPTQLVQLPGDGRLQDRWFDVSYTPVHETDDLAVGVHCTYYERTQEVLASRRLSVLNALGRPPRGNGRRDALADALAVLAEADDVPFAAGYLLDSAGKRVRLVAAVGVGEGEAMAPRELRPVPGAPWPLDQVMRTDRPVLVDDLATRFRGQRGGAESMHCERAVVHPLRDDAEGEVVGVLVVGLNPRTPLDDRYREFLTLAGDTIAARVSEAHAGRRERQRLERLAELDRAKTEFFSNVSHEFRTPLTLLVAPLQEALRRVEELPPDLVTDLEVAERNARRLLRLVGALLDFSQLEAGWLHARFVPTDLRVLTTEIASMFRSAAESAGLKLVVDARPLPELVWVDREMWEKVVSNLVSNALKFTWEGTVEVSLRALPKHAELVVRDTGVGIPADQLPHVFKRFHRVEGIRGRTHEGAGIGLSLVDELVRRHSGRVRATSTDAGTTITVWLPFGRRPQRDEDATPGLRTGTVAASMAEEARQWDAARADQRDREPDEELPSNLIGYAPGARILVVDDNADMRDYLVRLLGAAWDVIVARDGVEALEVFGRERPDLVLADVMMPRLDGFELLARIRVADGRATTPVVLVTARAGEETAIEGLLAGADDYVVKPFTARELVARVGAQLELAQLRRRHAELDAFRLALTDTLRGLADPAEMQARAAELVGRHLGVSRAYYQEFDEAEGTFTIHRNYTEGLPSLAGTYRLDDYGRDLVQETLRSGRPLVVRNSADLDETEAAAWAALSVRAGLSAPNLREGVCVAALGVTSATPRDWTDEEVALVEETADRTWAFVERVRAEAELRGSELRFRTLAEIAPALIWHIDAAGFCRFVNRWYLAFTGLPVEAVSEESWLELLHPDDTADYVAALRTGASERRAWQARARVRRHDGVYRELETRAAPLFDTDGTYVGQVGISFDVTDVGSP